MDEPNTYRRLLGEAIAHTRDAGWLDPSSEILAHLVLEGPFLGRADELVADAVDELIGTFRWSPRDLAVRCVDAHHNTLMGLCLRRIPALITIGEIYVDEKPRFDVSRASLAADVADADISRPVKAHAWLTLPGMQVVDITIRSHLVGSGACPTDLYRWGAVGCPVMDPPFGEIDCVDLFGDRVHLRWHPLAVGSTWIDLANPTIDGTPRKRMLDAVVGARFLRG